MKAIAAFRSRSFDLSWPKENRDPNDPPVGRDLAEHLRNRLKAIGIEASEPIQGADYWFLDLAVEGAKFSLVVRWAPFGRPPEDWWVVEPEKRLGIIKRMFGALTSFNDLRPICEVLHKILDQDPQISDLLWLDEQELQERSH
jgi:hypothetical protein